MNKGLKGATPLFLLLFRKIEQQKALIFCLRELAKIAQIQLKSALHFFS